MDHIKYKDRDGKEIDAVKCADLMQNPRYREIGFDHVGPFAILTEWKGMLHIPTGALFETTIHPSDLYPHAIHEKRRFYFTRQEAREGHAATIQKIKTKWMKEKGI